MDESRIIITNDKDFGELVYRQLRPHVGIVLLRISDSRAAAKIEAMDRVLAANRDVLEGAFVVVSDNGIRINR